MTMHIIPILPLSSDRDESLYMTRHTTINRRRLCCRYTIVGVEEGSEVFRRRWGGCEEKVMIVRRWHGKYNPWPKELLYRPVWCI